MFEKVNPKHPDKVADRIAGALVDLAYLEADNPRIAVEVLIGHGKCHIMDAHLSHNQDEGIRCGDNGIFKGTPLTKEQKELTRIAERLHFHFPFDGKYILDGEKLVICQSNAKAEAIRKLYPDAVINPLGDWTGGTDVDTGATNRKLGSDMADSVTGGGLHGKDLSKADVSVNIYCFLKALETGEPVELSCAIGDEYVDGRPYSEIVAIARDYVQSLGGFEKFAEWGLVR